MKLSEDWKNDLIQTIESNALPVQVARVFREALQAADFSLDQIKAIAEDLRDEIDWLETLTK